MPTAKEGKFNRQEIIKEVQRLMDKYLNPKDYEKDCPTCGASNCKNNETCINCKCQL